MKYALAVLMSTTSVLDINAWRSNEDASMRKEYAHPVDIPSSKIIIDASLKDATPMRMKDARIVSLLFNWRMVLVLLSIAPNGGIISA